LTVVTNVNPGPCIQAVDKVLSTGPTLERIPIFIYIHRRVSFSEPIPSQSQFDSAEKIGAWRIALLCTHSPRSDRPQNLLAP